MQPQPHCPKCQRPSSSFHSNNQRSVADLPWHGVAIKLQLHTCKFRCENARCPQIIFCERLPKAFDAYARKTVRLKETLTLLGSKSNLLKSAVFETAQLINPSALPVVSDSSRFFVRKEV
jgi:transposase